MLDFGFYAFGGDAEMAEADKTTKVDLALVLGYIATKDLPTTEKKVAILAKLGYSNQEMAKICGTSDTVVKTLKSKAKTG